LTHLIQRLIIVVHLLELTEAARDLGLDPAHRHAQLAVVGAEMGEVGEAEQRCFELGGLH
jgi:hypothetical protein